MSSLVLISRQRVLSHVTDKGKAVWFLALLSPIIAELMSGSSPPLEFFNPFSFVGLLGMYGAGVVLVRELSVRWGKGWASVIILGAAYGIIEEGLAVKSFFDPGWMDLGNLAFYGRFWSVNWVWAVWLTIYHSTISISLPILIFGLAYPEFKRSRILTEKQFAIVLVLFILDVETYAALLLFNYVPNLAQYMLAIAVVAFLVLAARIAPVGMISARHPMPTWKPWKFYFLGLLFISSEFVVASAAFTRGIHPLGTIALLLAFCAGTMLLLQHKMGQGGNEPQKASFAAGLMSFLVMLGFLLELGGVLGMAVVSVMAIIFLVDLNRMVRGKSVLLFFRDRVRRRVRLIM
jgi:hypothetical protein